MDQEIFICLEAGRVVEAFDLIAAHYRHRVYRLAFAILADSGLAEDASQEAFLRIWKALPAFRKDSALSTWIYSIVRNTSLNMLETKRSASPLPASRAPEWGPPSRAGFDVEALVSDLRPQYRQVVRLYYMQEKSYEEVAEMLAIPMGTVKTVLHRAKLEMAAALAGQVARENRDDLR